MGRTTLMSMTVSAPRAPLPFIMLSADFQESVPHGGDPTLRERWRWRALPRRAAPARTRRAAAETGRRSPAPAPDGRRPGAGADLPPTPPAPARPPPPAPAAPSPSPPAGPAPTPGRTA